MQCPCNPQVLYSDCCQRWHAGALYLQAPTPEALMRSRYSGFVLDLTDYLLATWHPPYRPSTLEPNPPDWVWLGLHIHSHTLRTPTEGTVHFEVHYRLGEEPAEKWSEHSRFIFENHQWWYLDGEA